MKPFSRMLMVGVAAAATAVLTTATQASAAPEVGIQADDFCAATLSGSTVSGNCTLDTFLGPFGTTFTGTVTNGSGSGPITMNAGILGTRTGTWTGSGFAHGSTATVNYTIPSPVGAFTGSFQVAIG